jgi:hypothetical protein
LGGDRQLLYRPGAFKALTALVGAGLLDLGLVRVSSFAFDKLPEAMEPAATMRGLDCTVVTIPH